MAHDHSNATKTVTAPVRCFIDRLLLHTSLNGEEQAAILELPGRALKVEGQCIVVRRGEIVDSSCIVVNGLLGRTGLTKKGDRQIISFYVAGDMPDLHSVMRPRQTFGLQALCESEIVRIPHAALRQAMNSYPAIAEAFSRELVREGDIAAEWVVNVGRRPAKDRIAHLFCEMAVKTCKPTEENTRFSFPVTQEVLGDATGLSTVHVNRSVMSLRQRGVLRFGHGQATIPCWKALVDVAGFDQSYLETDRPLRFAH